MYVQFIEYSDTSNSVVSFTVSSFSEDIQNVHLDVQISTEAEHICIKNLNCLQSAHVWNLGMLSISGNLII